MSEGSRRGGKGSIGLTGEKGKNLNLLEGRAKGELCDTREGPSSGWRTAPIGREGGEKGVGAWIFLTDNFAEQPMRDGRASRYSIGYRREPGEF